MSDRIELLVTVKAYPAVSTKYGEAVCVAGIRTDTQHPEWVRLFPVEFRDLDWRLHFKKYQHISVEAIRHSTDQRPETFRPDMSTVELGEVIDSKDKWGRRRALVEPLEVESMCEVTRRQALDGTSLGVFRPAVVYDFVIERAGAWSPAQEMVAAQPSLLFPTKGTLEQIPYKFSYHYSCGPSCKTKNGHTHSIIDWEIGQSFRSWTKYEEAERLEKIREQWLTTICGDDKDTRFFVGNTHVHQQSFMVLGTFWPPKLEMNDGDPR